MKLSLSLIVSVFAATCSGAAFERRAPIFGVPRGGGKKENDDGEKRADDYEAAEKRIFKAEKHAVEVVEHAIEDEVNTIFHEMPHHEKKEEDSKEKKEKPAKIVKRDTEGDEKEDDYETAEDKIFHAVENTEKKVLSAAHKAEQAVEHAIEDEVTTIFPAGENKKT